MKTSELKRFRILQELSEEERELIEEILEERGLSDGETLFAEGDEAEFVVFVSNGALVLTGGGESGVALPGTSLGECGLFAFGVRRVRAVSQGSTIVWLLRREDFRRLVDDYPRTAFRIAEAVIGEVSTRVQQIARA